MSFVDLNTYYQILGLKHNASVDDIKNTYRQKAKQFHPDRNKHPDAHEQFLLITEAYEMLTHKRDIPFFAIPTKDELRKKAREKAAQAARMRYEEFLKSDYYKYTTAISQVIDIFIILSVLAFAVFIIYQLLTASLILPALLVMLLLTGIGFGIYKYVIIPRDIQLRDYVHSISVFFRFTYTRLFILGIINIIVFLRIGLLTLVPTLPLFLLYALGIVFGILVAKIIRLRIKNYLPLLFPSLISLLLGVNYFFTVREYAQTYDVKYLHDTYTLHFTKNELHEFTGARFFFDQSQLRKNRYALYVFEEGCLGFTIVKQRIVI